MECVYVTILLALLEYMVMGGLVGFARTKYRVAAPATTGHPDFERTNRVHVNTDSEPVRFGRAMTRCECARVSFDEIARRVADEGQCLEAVQRETGCGRLCSACLPDLRDHLAARG